MNVQRLYNELTTIDCLLIIFFLMNCLFLDNTIRNQDVPRHHSLPRKKETVTMPRLLLSLHLDKRILSKIKFINFIKKWNYANLLRDGK